jgi:membrane associated rhomboid family serine protease
MNYQEPQGAPRRSFRIGPGTISPFIKWMLIINGGVFVFQFILGGWLEFHLGLTPARFFADFPNLLYQIFTYMFLHSTGHIFHLIFNMFILWMFGTEIEYGWGSKSFARYYLLAGLSGAILTLIMFSSQLGPTIGASGAIYGVLVAYWLMFPNRKLYIYFLFPVKVKWAIPGMMILSFLLSGGGVAHMAHLGGALFGLVYLKFDWHWLGLGRRIKTLRHRRQEAKLEKNRQKAEDVMKRVDSILDKINEVGMENLTPEERRFLDEASSTLSKKNHESDPNR